MVFSYQQIFKQNALEYDVWLTRAIIFVLDDRQVLFEKDYVPLSEEIIIRRGYDLAATISSEDEFLEGWDESITPNCTREIVKII